MRTLCDSCKRANVSCPIYPQETLTCIEYVNPDVGFEEGFPFGDASESTERNVQCNHCGGYNTYGNYDSELLEEPEKQPLFICNDCNKGVTK